MCVQRRLRSACASAQSDQSLHCPIERLLILGGSNEYPQSMFLNRNKINQVNPCKPQFYYIKVGFKGSKLHMCVFVMSSAVINPQWLELPMSRTNYSGPKMSEPLKFSCVMGDIGFIL